MPVSSAELSIAGVTDVVEFISDETGEHPYPVEYKRGRPKGHRADEVQLCAQALCLEAMFKCQVAEGALFYGQTRRRQTVTFDAVLRQLTLDTIHATREMIRSGNTPSTSYLAERCDACSLIDICQPQLLDRAKDVTAWLRKQIDKDS